MAVANKEKTVQRSISLHAPLLSIAPLHLVEELNLHPRIKLGTHNDHVREEIGHDTAFLGNVQCLPIQSQEHVCFLLFVLNSYSFSGWEERGRV